MGVDHVGVGVGDVDEAIEFYGRHVGFDRVLFDYTGELPGLEAVAGCVADARVAMLENSDATPIGPGRVKLVQMLDGDGPPPVPRARRGAKSASARSACTCATSRRCTTRSSPPAVRR